MRKKRDIQVNQRLTSLEKWRNNDILKKIIEKKDNGRYTYSLREIQDFYNISYSKLKNLMRENNIKRE